MSVTYNQAKAIISEISPIIRNSILYSCYETENRKFIIILKKQNTDFTLLLSFQEPFLRFHLSTQSLKPHETPLSKNISNTLKNFTLSDIELLNNDRILQITFKKNFEYYYLIGEFFPKKPNLYLADTNKQIIEILNQRNSTTYLIPKSSHYTHNDKNAPVLTNQLLEKFYADLESKTLFQEKKNKILSFLNIQKKSCDLKIIKRKEALVHCLAWEKVQHEGILLQANLYQISKGMNSIVICDWSEDNISKEFDLDPTLEPQEQALKRFKQSRKLRDGIPHITKLIDKLDKECFELTQQIQTIGQIENLFDLAKFDSILNKSKKNESRKKMLPYLEFFTENGLRIWVGKNAKYNDILTFQLCNGLDWWFHVADYAGSHVVLKNTIKKLEPDQKSLDDAVQMAIAYSKAKDQNEAAVCFTQKKFVSRLGKTPGKVQLSKHKIIYARFDPAIVKKIKDRKF